MNYILLKEYINKITKDKIKEMAIKNNIYLNKNELDILYVYIKNKYIEFIKEPDKMIKEIEKKITNENYVKLLNIYNQYNQIIKKYFN